MNSQLFWKCVVLAVVAISFIACDRKESVSHEGNSPLSIDETKLKKGEIIQPFAYIDPDKHDWRVEIRISGDDLFDISHKRMKARKFSTSKKNTLLVIRDWKFVYGRKSTHKATSTLRIYRDNQLVDKHGIVLEKNTLGFQSTKYGMLEPVDKNAMFETIEEMSHY